MRVLRAIKLLLIISVTVFAVAGGYVSFIVQQRQEALREVSRYNVVWAVSQALPEYIRLENRIAAYGLGLADKKEVKLRLDILFNNAGVSFPAKVEDITVDIWDRELNVHAKGVFLGTRTAIPAMRKGGGGSIINTSSVMGIVGSPTSPAYSAAKGAITTFTKSAALQYAKENIRINSVHPGYADTPMTDKRFSDPTVRQQLLDRTPMGRLGTAEDIANGVLFLASDEASWVTGSELVIDGGMTAQ